MRFLRRFHLLAGLVVAGLGGAVVLAQQPLPVPTVQPPPAQPKADEDTEVLARGPIHEAYASSGEVPTASPVVGKKPPAPVEELPPDQKPDGDNVLWIPGYWDYDDDRADFIWISGFWRNAPAGRVWVAGDWREAKGGYQWVPGFWNVLAQKQQPAELEYLPPPPELIESGPSVAAPNANCFYTPGCWVYRTNRYVWRPGYWVDHRPDWVWVPDHYRWTPVGYVFVPGFWDCPLDTRGVLFAPVYFRAAALDRPRFVYTPAYVVPHANLHTCLFVRTGHAAYYFGDYFEQRYTKFGYSSWCGSSVRGSNFAVSVSVSRTTYDPLWSYYSLSYRDTPQWQTNVTAVYVGRFKGDVPRPPRTVVKQSNVTNVTNVTNNNTTVVVNNPPAAAPVVTSYADAQRSQGATFRKVENDERVKEQKQARELNQFAAERRKVETALVDKGLAVTKDEKPRQAKLVVPEAVAVRAQAPAKPDKAPPPAAIPAKAAEKKPDVVVTPPPAAKVAPPTVDPKTGGVTAMKKVDPPKVDPPKPPVEGTKPVKPPVVVTPPLLPTKLADPVKPPVPPVKPPEVVKPPVVNPPKLPDPVKPPEVVKPKPPEVVKPPVVTPPSTTPPPKVPTPPVKPPEPPKVVDPPKTPPVVVPPKLPEVVKPPMPPVKPPEVVKPPMTPVKPPELVKPPVVVTPPPKPADPPKVVTKPPELPRRVEQPKPPPTVNPPPKQPTPTKPKEEKPKDKK